MIKTKGIRISDRKDGKCIPLTEILKTVPNEKQFFWVLLWFDVTPLKNEGKYLTEIGKKANESDNGLLFSFESIQEISKKIFQEIDVTIIACKEEKNLHRYEEDREMYETCDLVIEMIDRGFWEIFSKDQSFIEKLAKKFKKIEFVESDFEK